MSKKEYLYQVSIDALEITYTTTDEMKEYLSSDDNQRRSDRPDLAGPSGVVEKAGLSVRGEVFRKECEGQDRCAARGDETEGSGHPHFKFSV